MDYVHDFHQAEKSNFGSLIYVKKIFVSLFIIFQTHATSTQASVSAKPAGKEPLATNAPQDTTGRSVCAVNAIFPEPEDVKMACVNVTTGDGVLAR